MKPWATLVFLVLGLAAGFAAGYFAPRVAQARYPWTSAAAPVGADKIGPDVSAAASSSTNATVNPAAPPDLASLLKEPANLTRLRGLLAYVGALPVDAIPAAIKQAQDSPGDGGMETIGFLMDRWVSLDARGALAAAESPGPSRLHRVMLNGVFAAWAASDPDAALAQAQQIANIPDRNVALAAVTEKLAQTDPARALTLAQSLPPRQKQIATYQLFSSWAKTDLGQATQSGHRRNAAVTNNSSCSAGCAPTRRRRRPTSSRRRSPTSRKARFSRRSRDGSARPGPPSPKGTDSNRTAVVAAAGF
jgi:hypothetical protein